MKKKTMLVLTLTLLLSLTTCGIYTVSHMEMSESSSTTVYVDPPTKTAPLFSNFTVNINIENAANLYGWEGWLIWDPDVLNLVDVAEGDFFEPLGDTNWDVGESQGLMFARSFPTTFGGYGMSGNGTLANVTFRARSLGECSLSLVTRLFDASPVWVPTPPYLGDVNGDLVVNAIDLGAVGMRWGASIGDPSYSPDADFNNDGYIGIYDLLCCVFNFDVEYEPGDTAAKPVETAHTVMHGYVATYMPPGYVAWKWLDAAENPVWLNTSVVFPKGYSVENFNFNRSLGQMSFSFASAQPGFCNISIPKLLMDGAFKVLVNDAQVPSILTWNESHTLVCFTHDQGTHNITIVGEIVTRIRGPRLTALADVNGDGNVDIFDIQILVFRFGWKEDC